MEGRKEGRKEGGGHGAKDRGLTCCSRIRRTCVAVERTDGYTRYCCGTGRASELACARAIHKSFTVPFKNVLITGRCRGPSEPFATTLDDTRRVCALHTGSED